MPKNKGKGGKGHKKGNGGNDEMRRELVFKSSEQEYATVTKMLGGMNVEVRDVNGKKLIGRIRGAFKKRTWIVVGDLVLLGLRDFEDDKADVIYKYTNDEAKMLHSYGEIPSADLNTEKVETDELQFELQDEFDVDNI